MAGESLGGQGSVKQFLKAVGLWGLPIHSISWGASVLGGAFPEEEAGCPWWL